MCTRILRATLFIIAINQKLCKYLSTVKWVNKWYVHIMENNATLRINNEQVHYTWRVSSLSTILSELSQAQKKKKYMVWFHLIWRTKEDKSNIWYYITCEGGIVLQRVAWYGC